MRDPGPHLLLAVLLSWVLVSASAATAQPAAGPILVVAGAANPFGQYLGEILLAEGFGAVPVADLADLSPALLASRDVVVLGEAPLTAAQAQVLVDWVTAGGRLVAMRPDKRLAGLLGIADRGAVLSNGYLTIDTTAAPGAGITGVSMQFHGDADLYDLAGATAVATLSSGADTPPAAPAVTLRAVGSGRAAAFTYDLARSVVYTRQGNPAWAWTERDGIGPLRSDDLFYGPAAGDPHPDWVDFSRIAIPQADEQQRLLVNLVLGLTADRTPLPRLWYFPRGLNAVLVMTGDDHAHGGTAARFDQYRAASPAGCSLPDWECVRSTSYLYPGTPITPAQVTQALADGFEIGLHVNTNCAIVTGDQLGALWDDQWAALTAQLPGLPPLLTNRNHCVSWSGWATTATVERQHGVRLDANYYYWPPQWVQDRPGLFTGSGIPMRFADLDGTPIDVYQLTTQMTDESGQSYPSTVNALLDGALGPNGYVAALCANMHTDWNPWPPSDAIVAACRARGVPVISSRQMLDWLNGRNGSAFGGFSWSGDSLRFTLAAPPEARGLMAMLPLQHAGGTLAGIWRDGQPVDWSLRTVKGVCYAFFPALSGGHVAWWDTAGPAASGIAATTPAEGSAWVSWRTSQATDSRVDYGLSPGMLDLSVSDSALTTAHRLPLVGLLPGTQIWYRVSGTDPLGRSVIAPPRDSAASSFLAAGQPCLSDRSADDFAAGATGPGSWIGHDGPGGVALPPAFGAELVGASMPPGWTTAVAPGGVATLTGAALLLQGASAGSVDAWGPGRTLEFEAAFGPAPRQRVGFTGDGAFVGFATTADGDSLQAVSGADTSLDGIPLPGRWRAASHRFAVAWDADSVRFSIDGGRLAALPAVNDTLHAGAGDATGQAPLILRWMRLSPYAATGTFVSRVFDSGAASPRAVGWAADLPDPNGLAFGLRGGDTPSPDPSWTPFLPLSGGSTLPFSQRYLQYRVTLSTSDPRTTPELRAVTFSCGAPTAVALPTRGATALLAPRPNPASHGTTVAWEIGRAQDGARVRVRIFDLQGRCVRTLFDAPAVPGPFRVAWDGRAATGGALPPGIYRIRLDAQGVVQSQALVMLR